MYLGTAILMGIRCSWDYYVWNAIKQKDHLLYILVFLFQVTSWRFWNWFATSSFDLFPIAISFCKYQKRENSKLIEERFYHVKPEEHNILEYVHMKTIGFPKKKKEKNTMVWYHSITYMSTKIWVQRKQQ